MKTRFVSATEFKTHCLALLDEVNEQGGTITVTKRGKPVATVGPVKTVPRRSPKGILEGKLKIIGDIDNFDTADLWDVVRQNDAIRKSRR